MPCILVIGVNKHGNLQAVNLRWLLPPFVAQALKMAGGGGVSYGSIKSTNIRDGYRTYKVKGLRNVRVLDTAFMRGVLRSIQQISPNEVNAIRQEIERQLAARLNPLASSLTGTQVATPAAQQAPQDASKATQGGRGAGPTSPVAPIAPIAPTPPVG